MVKVFISYRREDSQYQTDRLYDLLSNYVDDPAKDIFLDVDNIPYGVDFVEHLEGKVSECEMVLAVIGKNWISVKDPETGERRLENPNDFIRIEIATALKRGIPVVPVLLDGAPVPRPEQLPEDMKALSRRNGVIVNRMSFSADVETLVNGLPISLKARSGSSPPPTTPLPPADDGGAQKMWASIEQSLDPRDYKEFQTYFANSKWSFEAGRRIRQLNDWEEVDKDDAEAIAQFRGHARDIAPLFDALDGFTEKTMRRAADRALKTERASAVQHAELKPKQAPLHYEDADDGPKTPEPRKRSNRVLWGGGVLVASAVGAFFLFGQGVELSDPVPAVTETAPVSEALQESEIVADTEPAPSGERQWAPAYPTPESDTEDGRDEFEVLGLDGSVAAFEAYLGNPQNTYRREETQERLQKQRDAIAKLQQALNDKGYNAGTPDGIPGLRTSNAIQTFVNNQEEDVAPIDLSYLYPDAIEEFTRTVVAGKAATTKRAGQTFRDTLSGGGRGPQMVVIPSGSFRMGSPSSEAGRKDDEGPQLTVRINYQFAVGKFEVTWAEWEACVADGGCSNSGPDGRGGDEDWGKVSRPVINVSWEDAQAYVSWLSRKTGEKYRLLSEAEWEYVARAGTTSAYSWGNSIGSNRANCDGCGSRWGNRQAAPVGSFSANAFGLYDLHGNVWEWTQDCYVDSYSGAPTDGSARIVSDCELRVLRGGSWGSHPWNLRSADRVRYNPTFRSNGSGFRVARTL